MLRLRDIKNRGKAHVFLGEPFDEDVDKTTVEPGCAFSPGLWSCGISIAVVANNELIAPQTRDLPLSFENEMPPIVESCYAVGNANVHSRIARLDSVDYFECVIGGEVNDAAIIISDYGPAGGEIDSITVIPENGETVIVRKGKVAAEIHMFFETEILPEIYPPDESHDSAFAIMHFSEAARFTVAHTLYYTTLISSSISPKLMKVGQAFEEARRRFETAVPARIFAPDKRIENAWNDCAFHIISAMETGLPRIGVANYPILWLRDCVIVLRALDLIGRSDLARIGCDALAPLIFSGGFGCEADNPGEGIWVLVSHYLMTGDAEWLRSVYPDIIKRVGWIKKMLTAEETIRIAGNNRTVFAMSTPGFSLVCLPAENGHIHGRMDGHFPDFYINCWAYAGLRFAAKAAKVLGNEDDYRDFSQAAGELDSVIERVLFRDYGNERDSCVVPYPTGAMSNSKEEKARLAVALESWYDKNRLDADGKRISEKLWTYFEVAQLHNMMLTGNVEKAWVNLNGILDEPRFMGMSLFSEGEWNHTEMLPFGNGNFRRGWLQEGAYAANMPHNWTTGEMMLMLRDMFVHEEGDGLIILTGVPKAWDTPGSRYGVKDMPTHFGKISFTVTITSAGRREIEFTKGGDIPWRAEGECQQ